MECEKRKYWNNIPHSIKGNLSHKHRIGSVFQSHYISWICEPNVFICDICIFTSRVFIKFQKTLAFISNHVTKAFSTSVVMWSFSAQQARTWGKLNTWLTSGHVMGVRLTLKMNPDLSMMLLITHWRLWELKSVILGSIRVRLITVLIRMRRGRVWKVRAYTICLPPNLYCKTHQIPNLNVSCLVLQLSLPKPLQPGVKLKMKM